MPAAAIKSRVNRQMSLKYNNSKCNKRKSLNKSNGDITKRGVGSSLSFDRFAWCKQMLLGGHRCNHEEKTGTRTKVRSFAFLFRWSLIFWQTVVMLFIPKRPNGLVLGLQHQQPSTVQGLPVHRVPLRQEHVKHPMAPYCFAVSSIADLPASSNFLATQVWPSARVAAKTLEELILASDDSGCWFTESDSGGGAREKKNKFTICELGCGPGLPSLAAATAAANSWNNISMDFKVIATDLDEFGLDLVNAAAKEQGLDNILSTRRLDLIEVGSVDWTVESEKGNAWMEDVDLFVMSDVFESKAVAIAAACLTKRVLSWRNGNDGVSSQRKRVWVFAQTDRAQREVYLRELQRLSFKDSNLSSSLKWSPPETCNLRDLLWLCDVDETLVDYG